MQDLGDINIHSLKEYQHFFETYKQLKGKPVIVEIKGYKGKADTHAAVLKSVELYKKEFGSK